MEDNSWVQELSQYKRKEVPGALETLGKSAFRAAPEAIGNLMLKMGLTSPKTFQEALPRDESLERGQLAHPFAAGAGGIIGFGPLGVGTGAIFRSVPGISRLMQAAAPSLFKRAAVHGAEGAAMGALYSPPGQEGKSALEAGMIGSLLGGPGVSLARNTRNISKSGRNVINTEELGQRAKSAEQANIEQQTIINALKKQYATEPLGFQTPESGQKLINKRQEALQSLQPSTEIPYQQTENLLTTPKEMDIQEASKLADRNYNSAIDKLETSLGKGETLDVSAANNIQKGVKDIKQWIQKNKYQSADNYAKDNHVAIPNSGPINLANEALRHNISVTNPEFLSRNPGFLKELEESLVKQRKPNDLIPMTDFIGQWKATRNAAANARSRAFKEGEPDQHYWQKEEEKLTALTNQQLAALKDHLPPEIFQDLMEASKLWKEQVIPFYGNKIYEQSKQGKINVKNIMHEVRGDNPGDAEMRRLIISNPELNKQVIGHAYSEKPTKLLTLNKNESQFLNAHPGLKQDVESLRTRTMNKNIANRIYKNQKEEHEELKNRIIKTEVPKQKERQEAINKSKKLEQEIKIIEQKKVALEKEYQKGNITEEAFHKNRDEYSKALSHKKSFLKNTLKIIGTIGGLYGVGNAISRLLTK